MPAITPLPTLLLQPFSLRPHKCSAPHPCSPPRPPPIFAPNPQITPIPSPAPEPAEIITLPKSFSRLPLGNGGVSFYLCVRFFGVGRAVPLGTRADLCQPPIPAGCSPSRQVEHSFPAGASGGMLALEQASAARWLRPDTGSLLYPDSMRQFLCGAVSSETGAVRITLGGTRSIQIMILFGPKPAGNENSVSLLSVLRLGWLRTDGLLPQPEWVTREQFSGRRRPRKAKQTPCVRPEPPQVEACAKARTLHWFRLVLLARE